MTTAFDAQTGIEILGDDRYGVSLDRSWWVMAGPNGGYVAAILLRAMEHRVGDPTRAPRSLTVHYASPASEGAAEVQTTVEREGRSLTTITARLTQDGRTIALAIGAFSRPRESVEFCDLSMPQVPGADRYRSVVPPPGSPPIASRWETRWAIGHPPGTAPARGARAVAGGWIRLPEPQLVDAPVLAAITDGWLPPMFSRTVEPVAVPTVDLTIHFRATLPHPGLAAEDFVLASFRTTVAADGFLEEDGEVWAPDGTLLAQSRQLAVILPLA